MLRRTFLSTLLHTGTDIETARELAGHSSVIVTQAYLSSTDRVKRRAVEGLSFSGRGGCNLGGCEKVAVLRGWAFSVAAARRSPCRSC